MIPKAKFEIEFAVNPGELAINQAYQPVRDPRSGGCRIRKSRRYRSAVARLGEAVMLSRIRNSVAVLSGGLCVTVLSVWPREHRKGPATGLALGDADAPIKGILDALEAGGIFHDDAQVVEVLARKAHDHARPRVHIWIY